LIALDAWADQGIEPPKSNYPRVADSDGDDDSDSEEGRNHRSGGGATLVSIDEARAAFPAIPGVNFPSVMNELEVLDFGPLFNSVGGRLTVLPPLRGASYRVFVPKPDMDGLGVAGIRPMEIRVPLGTNTGWNVRAPGARAPNLCGLNGSFIPFAKTKAERLASGDPRRSLEERYRGHEGFVKAVRNAAMDLNHDGFLLQEDANTWIKAAEASIVLR
jgi:hypothetical protein